MKTKIKKPQKVGLSEECLRPGHWYECTDPTLSGEPYLCVMIGAKKYLCLSCGTNLTMNLERYTYREIKPTVDTLEFEYV